MKDSMQSLLDVIVIERNWSWMLIVVLYLLIATIVRLWFLLPVVRAAKKVDRHLYHDIRSAFLKKSIWGWIFYLIPLALIAGIWYRKDIFPITVQDMLILLAALASFILSVLLHLKGFSLAAIQILHRALEKATGKEF